MLTKRELPEGHEPATESFFVTEHCLPSAATVAETGTRGTEPVSRPDRTVHRICSPSSSDAYQSQGVGEIGRYRWITLVGVTLVESL